MIQTSKESFGLKENLILELNKIFFNHTEIEEVILYGSRAKGNFRINSDIDLTFKGNDLNLNLMNKIYLEIDDLLTPYSFDLSIFKQIDNPDLIEHINRVGISFYKKNIL